MMDGNWMKIKKVSHKKLEKQKLDNFESNLIIGVFYLKNSNLELAKKCDRIIQLKGGKVISDSLAQNV